jgi:hypothetical protein
VQEREREAVRDRTAGRLPAVRKSQLE